MIIDSIAVANHHAIYTWPWLSQCNTGIGLLDKPLILDPINGHTSTDINVCIMNKSF